MGHQGRGRVFKVGVGLQGRGGSSRKGVFKVGGGSSR